MLERRIDDYWNVEGNRDLSDSWTGFTRFTILDEKPPNGSSWSMVRLMNKQTTSQARLLVARDMERHVRSSATKRKTKVGYRKTEA